MVSQDIIKQLKLPENTIVYSEYTQQRWTVRTKTEYVNKGYTYTKLGDYFDVHILDLTYNSTSKVEVGCAWNNCRYKETITFYELMRKTTPYCPLHRSTMNMLGKEFGSLTVTKQLPSAKSRGAMWELTCICKNKIRQSTGGLNKRPPKSCDKGSCHSRYNPLLTSLDRTNLRRVEEDKWAYNVKIRDNFTCQICGDNKGGNLETHHIYARNIYIELREVMENGITLCIPCHIEFHDLYGRGNNTLEQFILFCRKRNVDILQYKNIRELQKLKV